MTPDEIKGELMKKGLKLSDVARATGRSHTHVSRVVCEGRPSPTIRSFIANAIGKPVHKIFPPSAA